jgi:homoserine kinase type II
MSVYTPINTSELNAFLTQYSVGELLHYSGISAGIENTNYFVDTTKGRYVLTLFEHHSLQEMHYFIDLMAWLAKSGVPTATPIQQNSGQTLSLLKGKPASLVSCLKGNTVEKQLPNQIQCAAIASGLATLHLAGQNFAYSRLPDRGAEWRQKMGAQLLQHPALNSEDQTLLQNELNYQAAFDFSILPQGVIHADLFRDNALFEGDTLSGIIDLYYACNDSLLFDIAVVINDWCCHDNGQIDQQKLSLFLNAYQAIRPLEAIEHKYWFATLKAAALRFWLSRLYDQFYPRDGELTQSKDPEEYKHKLKMLIDTQTQLEKYELNYGGL